MLIDHCAPEHVQQNGTSATQAQALAVEQWAQCSVLPQPLGEELCRWARQSNTTHSSSSLSVAAAGELLNAFLGNSSMQDAQ
jgi:hypothetical protein